MKGTRANEKLFWNHRAASYPKPFEKETRAKTGRILRLVERLGVGFEGRRVLDIGCGTGVYALQLAGKAKSVLGLDSSPEMLRIFRGERRKRRIKNASCLLSAWSAAPSSLTAGRFDIALASMTMAIKTEADLRKMETAAAHCVYIGWAGARSNPLLKKIYARHGVAYKAPEGAAVVLKFLKKFGREPRVKFIRDRWEKKASPAETMRDIEVGLKVNGAKMDAAWVETLLKKITRNGLVKQTTSVRKAVIVWRSGAAGA
ncbi:MAG: class I SAM-dependent methyltransferase [Elusimicrobiales bacterium]|jgi:SAM-dependent methyltransferase